MRKSRIPIAAPVFAASLLMFGASACELLVDFDRSLIPQEGGLDGSLDGTADGTTTEDSSTTETGADSSMAMDSTSVDSGSASDSATARDSESDGASTDGSESKDSATVETGNGCETGVSSCTSPSACPASSTLCVVDTCSSGCCGTSNASSDTTCSDNGGTVCDGAGHCVACLTAANCAAQSTLCKINTCTANSCGITNAAAETTCTDNGGSVCNGNGSCVACVTAADCAPQSTVCKTNTCAANACGTSNVSLGTMCTDSGGTVCNGNGSCVAATCSDGIKDGNETDVDCGGGTCPPCADTKDCKVGSDCVDKVCSGNPLTCQAPTCSDGVQNGQETDVDCGGPTCDAQGKTCALGKRCGTGADCTDDTCTSNVCVTAGNGAACTSNAECTSGVCDINGTGNCCAASCVGGACGATSCDTSGACVYPGNTVAPPMLQTPGDCQQIVCSGNGSTTSVNAPTNLPTSTTVCETNPACTGNPLTPNFTPAPTGTPCTADNHPPNQVCGDTSNSNIAGTCVECNVDSDCLAINDAGTLTCNTSIGQCQ
jgi:hypothetical protein